MRYLFPILLLLLASCSDGFDPIDFERDVNLPKEYTYEISTSCFCLTSYIGPHFMHIREGQIVDYRNLTDEEFSDDAFIETLTIEAVTKRVNDILQQNPVRQDLATHPTYQFPTSGYFDISEQIADEEWGFEITQFTVIED